MKCDLPKWISGKQATKKCFVSLEKFFQIQEYHQNDAVCEDHKEYLHNLWQIMISRKSYTLIALSPCSFLFCV